MELQENKITLRRLCTRDLFPMMKILSKIGISEFRQCFDSAAEKIDIKEIEAKDNGIKEIIFNRVGISVMLDIAGIIMKNIGSCERDIYNLLGSLSGMEPREIPELDLAVTAEMINDLVKKEEFRDFFTVVLKLFQTGKSEPLT